MKLNRICKICGKDFLGIKITQFFCCRKCFKKDYYIRTKANLTEEKQTPNYPIKKCAFCEERSRLDFDPVKNPKKFDGWSCPHCGVTNKLIWEHQNNYNSYQIISQLVVTLRLKPAVKGDTTYKYKVYKLPITRLEAGNKNILVMSCDTLSLLDLQKGDRKKIIFS